MVKLGVSIMAHPVRRLQVEELQQRLDREAPVAYDVKEKPSKDPRQRWATGRAAWEMHDPGTDFHLVIQDDAVPASDLLAGVEKMLEQVPSHAPVSLYLGTTKPLQTTYLSLIEKAEEESADFIVTRTLSWGVAMVLPTHTIPNMLRWCDRDKTLAYDKRIGIHYRDRLRLACWYPWPSLVDHHQGPSIVGHGNGDRVAHRTLSGSALDHSYGPSYVLDPGIRGRLKVE